VKQELPGTCLQWEDFGTPHARPILQRYRDQLLTFNDDIQGTAATALGAVLGAVAVTKRSLKEQQIVMLGAGSAGIGVADGLRAAMRLDGLSEQESRSRFWVIDKDGLLHSGRKDLQPEQAVYAQPESRLAGWPRTRAETSGWPTWSARSRRRPSSVSPRSREHSPSPSCERWPQVAAPDHLPLSNPTSKSEARPEDLMTWTDGRALVATGSPFAPVSYGGRTIRIPQCNNVYVFPTSELRELIGGLPAATPRDRWRAGDR